jgi:endonuclease/exonuclease/phosphatase family metal-dependent hydrolase
MNEITFPLQFLKKYKVDIGEGLYVCGSLPELGSWDTRKAVKCFWHKGDNWRQEVLVKIHQIPLTIEYKFVIMSYDKPLEEIQKWQEGPNTRVTVTWSMLKDMASTKINCMTFNIRCDRDTKPGRSWNDRKMAVLQLVKQKNTDFIAFQEAEYLQFRY